MAEPSRVHSIRLPVSLFQAIKEEAERSDRTFNRVLVRMIQAQLAQNKRGTGQGTPKGENQGE